jgi:hypothetical protein
VRRSWPREQEIALELDHSHKIQSQLIKNLWRFPLFFHYFSGLSTL